MGSVQLESTQGFTGVGRTVLSCGGSGAFPSPSGWHNSVPCGCRADWSVTLLALSWG